MKSRNTNRNSINVTNGDIFMIITVFVMFIFAVKYHDNCIRLERTVNDLKIAAIENQNQLIEARIAEVNARNEAELLERKVADITEKYDNIHHTLYDSPIDHKHIFKFTITAYTASKKECGKSDGITSTMEHVNPGITCAVSRDHKELLHKHVYIVGVGRRYINDTMQKDIRDAIDLNMKYVKNAIRFGRLKSLRVIVLD